MYGSDVGVTADTAPSGDWHCPSCCDILRASEQQTSGGRKPPAERTE